MQFVCRCGPVISHLIKRTSCPLECSLQHPADGNGKFERFQSCFLYTFAFRNLRNVLKKFSMCGLPTHYTIDKNHCRENERSSASQEIPRILWNTNVHITVYKRARHFSLRCARRIQCTPPHAISYYQSIKLYFTLFIQQFILIIVTVCPGYNLWHLKRF